MDLSNGQLATLKSAILAETDAAFVAARDVGDVDAMAAFLNTAATPAEKAWRTAVSRGDLFEAADLTVFDSLSAGKRDAWKIMLEMAGQVTASGAIGLDFSRNKIRARVVDIWGASTSTSSAAFKLLTAATRDVSKVEKILGGTQTATEGTGSGAITAKRLAWTGPITGSQIADTLNS